MPVVVVVVGGAVVLAASELGEVVEVADVVVDALPVVVDDGTVVVIAGAVVVVGTVVVDTVVVDAVVVVVVDVVVDAGGGAPVKPGASWAYTDSNGTNSIAESAAPIASSTILMRVDALLMHKQ